MATRVQALELLNLTANAFSHVLGRCYARWNAIVDGTGPTVIGKAVNCEVLCGGVICFCMTTEKVKEKHIVCKHDDLPASGGLFD